MHRYENELFVYDAIAAKHFKQQRLHVQQFAQERAILQQNPC